ncbi:MAG TPA: IS3 family transposase [Bacillaceae bacterium]
MRKEYPVQVLCRVLGVSRSGYYAHLKRPPKPPSDRDARDAKAIKKLFKKKSGTYGAKRISGVLKSQGHVINHKRVARLMKELNLKSTIRAVKTKQKEKDRSAGFVYPNLLERDFTALFPNRKWVTDISELLVDGGKLYFTSVMDLYNREIVSFTIGDSPGQSMTEECIRAAMKSRNLPDLRDVIIHSDQGSVYRSYDHHKLSKELKFIPSMSRKANCWDNAVIESFFSQLKTEFPYLYPVTSAAQVREDLPRYIAYFNEERSQKRLGYLTPAAFLAANKQAS